MSADDRNNKLDELLDAALMNYSRVEPPPGLEPRILAALEAPARRAPLLAWSGWLLRATAVVVALVAAMLVFQRPSAPPPAPPATRAQSPAPGLPPPAVSVPAAPAASAPAAMPSRLAAAPQAPAATLPRRQRFPSPAPLSQQELYLLRYLETARSSPLPAPEKEDAFAALTLEPLELPALRIEKLERNP